MSYLCDNPLCKRHVLLDRSQENLVTLEVRENHETVRVERYYYVERDGKIGFSLCDVCHSAVQMVVGTGTHT